MKKLACVVAAGRCTQWIQRGCLSDSIATNSIGQDLARKQSRDADLFYCMDVQASLSPSDLSLPSFNFCITKIHSYHSQSIALS
jgi:hypothetical protein